MRSEELHPVPTLPRAKGQLRDGIAYVRSRPDIVLVMAILFVAGTFGFNFQMTTALMATEVYGKGAGEYGILGSILAVGSLTGALIAARRTSSSQRLVVVAAIVFGLVTLAAGLMPTYLTFALVLPVAGITSMTLMTAANSFVQMAADPAMRGRVLALYLAVFMGGTPVGAPLLGWVAEHAGARWTLIGGGGLTALGTIADRRLHRPPPGRRAHPLRVARPPTPAGLRPRRRRLSRRVVSVRCGWRSLLSTRSELEAGGLPAARSIFAWSDRRSRIRPESTARVARSAACFEHRPNDTRANRERTMRSTRTGRRRTRRGRTGRGRRSTRRGRRA